MREETRQDIISAEEMGTKYDEAAKSVKKMKRIDYMGDYIDYVKKNN